MERRTDRLGRMREYVYYDNGQLKDEIWKNPDQTIANVRTFTYNAAGQVLTASDSSGTIGYTYDDLGRIDTQNDVHGLVLNYDWNKANQLTAVTDSLGGVRTYEYDDAGRNDVRTFSAPGQAGLRLEIEYTARGEVESFERYSDAAGLNLVSTTGYGYDNAGRLELIDHKDSQAVTIDSFSYVYDSANRIKSIVSPLSGTTYYDYDKTGQVVSDGTKIYNYDLNGNRTNPGYVTGGANRLETDGTWDYDYDDEGSLIEKTHLTTGEVWQYGYNHLNQLVQVEHKPSDTEPVDLNVEFKYDIWNNRVEKSVDPDGDGPQSASVAKFAYDGQNAWADLDSQGNLIARRLYLDAVDSVFAKLDAAGNGEWYLKDHLGSVREIIDANAVVKNRLDYDGFGRVTYESNPANGDRYQYTSREYDQEIDLQYNRWRYYDVETARWISRDPIGFDAGDSNLYRYVHNRSTVATDPSGLDEVTWDGLIRFATVRNIPTTMITALKDEDDTSFYSRDSSYYRNLFRWPFQPNNIIGIEHRYYEILAAQKTDELSAKAALGHAFNELIHAYYDQIIEEKESCKWIRDLMDEAALNWAPSVFNHYIANAIKRGPPFAYTVSKSRSKSIAKEMIEEAMSEMAHDLIEFHLSNRLPQGLTNTEPKMGRGGGSGRGFGEPGHDQWNHLRANKWPVSKDIRNLTLWIMQHGCKKATKAELARNWNDTFKK